MKALLSRPSNGNIMKILHRQVPVVVPVAGTAYMRPVEIKRYIRNLRETRHYHFTRDFLY